MDAEPSPAPPRTRLACLDMAGTLVADDGLVLQGFSAALDAAGLDGERLEEAMRYALATMGQAKSAVFEHLLGKPLLVAAAVEVFDATVGQAVESGRVNEITGAREAMSELRSMDLGICLTTGFSPGLQATIIEHLGWGDLVDFSLAPGPGLRGRPYPDMVLAAMLRAQVDDVKEVAVVGDTASDLLSGSRAGAAVVVGVLTGSHGRPELEAAPHTHIISSIADFPALFSRGQAH